MRERQREPREAAGAPNGVRETSEPASQPASLVARSLACLLACYCCCCCCCRGGLWAGSDGLVHAISCMHSLRNERRIGGWTKQTLVLFCASSTEVGARMTLVCQSINILGLSWQRMIAVGSSAASSSPSFPSRVAIRANHGSSLQRGDKGCRRLAQSSSMR